MVNISVHDTRSVIFFKNLVWVRYSGLVDLHQHLFHVPEGSIKDISGRATHSVPLSLKCPRGVPQTQLGVDKSCKFEMCKCRS